MKKNVIIAIISLVIVSSIAIYILYRRGQHTDYKADDFYKITAFHPFPLNGGYPEGAFLLVDSSNQFRQLLGTLDGLNLNHENEYYSDFSQMDPIIASPSWSIHRAGNFKESFLGKFNLPETNFTSGAQFQDEYEVKEEVNSTTRKGFSNGDRVLDNFLSEIDKSQLLNWKNILITNPKDKIVFVNEVLMINDGGLQTSSKTQIIDSNKISSSTSKLEKNTFDNHIQFKSVHEFEVKFNNGVIAGYQPIFITNEKLESAIKAVNVKISESNRLIFPSNQPPPSLSKSFSVDDTNTDSLIIEIDNLTVSPDIDPNNGGCQFDCSSQGSWNLDSCKFKLNNLIFDLKPYLSIHGCRAQLSSGNFRTILPISRGRYTFSISATLTYCNNQNQVVYSGNGGIISITIKDVKKKI